MQTTWRLASSDSTTDFKELIPEFFFLPEIFLNSEGDRTYAIEVNYLRYMQPCHHIINTDSAPLPPIARVCLRRAPERRAGAQRGPAALVRGRPSPLRPGAATGPGGAPGHAEPAPLDRPGEGRGEARVEPVIIATCFQILGPTDLFLEGESCKSLLKQIKVLNKI